MLTIELPRAKRLYEQGQLDNYLLYSNRYLTANANEEILTSISQQTGIPRECIHLCGIEALDEAFLREPKLAQWAGINPLDRPLVTSSRELAEVVEAIALHFDNGGQEEQSRPQKRTSLADKNELSSMSERTLQRLIKNYGYLLSQIQEFLADPANSEIRELYISCAKEFDLKIPSGYCVRSASTT